MFIGSLYARSPPSDFLGSRLSLSLLLSGLAKRSWNDSSGRNRGYSMAVTTGLKQTVYPVRDRTARYNTHQSDVASPHRSITAAPEERSTTSLVPHYHDQICPYCFLCYLLILLSYPELLLSLIRTDNIHCQTRVHHAEPTWCNV